MSALSLTAVVYSYASSTSTSIVLAATSSPLGALYPTGPSVASTSVSVGSPSASIASLAQSSTKPLTTSTSTPSSTSSNIPVVHTVYVGNGNHKFLPNTTYANIGDIISFVFYPTNHSVVRGAYGFPCVPYENTFPGKTGFFSGHFLTDGTGSSPVWNLTINSTETLWYYCTAAGSCTPNGMIGVINPPINASTALAYQEEQAKNAQYQLQPGEAVPAETAPAPTTTPSSSSITSATVANTPSPTSPPATSPTYSASANPSPTPSPSLSHGIIAGIAMGAILGLVAIAAAIYYCGRNSVYRQWYKSEKKTQLSTESWLSGQQQYQAQQAQMAALPPRMEMADARPKGPVAAHESYVGSLASGPVSPPLAEPGWWRGDDFAGAGVHGQVEELGSGHEQRAQNYDDPAELEAWRREQQQQPIQSTSTQPLDRSMFGWQNYNDEVGERHYGGRVDER